MFSGLIGTAQYGQNSVHLFITVWSVILTKLFIDLDPKRIKIARLNYNLNFDGVAELCVNVYLYFVFVINAQ